MGLPLEYTKGTKTGYSAAVDVLGASSYAPIVSRFLELSSNQQTPVRPHIIGLQEAICSPTIRFTLAMFRILTPDEPLALLSLKSPTQNNSLFVWSKGVSFQQRLFIPEWSRQRTTQFGLFPDRKLRVLCHIRRTSITVAARHGEDFTAYSHAGHW